jgi:hypothetical protein
LFPSGEGDRPRCVFAAACQLGGPMAMVSREALTNAMDFFQRGKFKYF